MTVVVATAVRGGEVVVEAAAVDESSAIVEK